MLQLEYTITEEEFLNYNYFVGWMDPAKKLKRLKFYLFAIIGFPVIAGFLLSQGKKTLELSSIIYIVIGTIALLLLLRFRLRPVFDKQAKKLLQQPGGDTILSRMNATIEEKGFFLKTKTAEAKYEWNAFQRKVIANNCYYLFVNARQAAIIPFSAFQSPAEREKFDALLLQYLPLKTELKQFA